MMDGKKTNNPTDAAPDGAADVNYEALTPTAVVPGAMRQVNAKADWAERYRPTTLEDVLLPKGTRQRLQSFNDGRSTVLLLAGSPGTGKTSVAKALIGSDDLDKYWHDCSDGFGIDFVNSDLMNFVHRSSWTEGARKIAVLDELDSASVPAMAALRGKKLEEYAEYCSFILICNDISKISAPVRSRSLVVDVDAYTDAEKAELRELYRERITWIVDRENAGLGHDVVDVVIDAFFPSMRAMLKELASLAGTKPDVELLRERLQNQQTMTTAATQKPKTRRKAKAKADAAVDLPPTNWQTGKDERSTLPAVLSPAIQGSADDAGTSDVSLDLLLDEIVALLKRHLYLPDGAYEAIALFIVFTHMHEAARFSPLLLLTAAVMASGKTTTLTLVMRLSYSPTLAANISPAAVFRATANGDTLGIDEADPMMIKPGDLLSIFNSSFTPDFATVLRATAEYSVWCPKVVAKNGMVHSTLASRSIVIDMRPPLPGHGFLPLPYANWPGYSDLRDRIAVAAERLIEAFRVAQPKMPVALTGRAADRWQPLLAIADLAGPHWSARARQAALLLTEGKQVPDEKVVLLADLRAIFAAGESKLFTRDIVQKLVDIQTSPWARRLTGSSQQQGSELAKLLKPFGIHPKPLRRGADNSWGYVEGDFDDAWARYLPPPNDEPADAAAA